MPRRARWCPWTTILCLLFGIVGNVSAECWYDETSHEEGTEVATAEPCLNCTCSRGALLCYLRICPRLPNPPPPGCILLHRYRTCCPQLICTEFYHGNGLEARSEPDAFDLAEGDRTLLGNACIANGSIYGPGSAMDSSTQCEYCYCLGGKARCVKPKCLLPIDGCTPIYDKNNCCPVRYNCTRLQLEQSILTTSTTTTTKKPTDQNSGGCMVDGIFYKEGGKVLGVGHSACDNCYCLRGLLRCEPLECAPPLLGCSPVIRPGECCAASYNCSGTIETQPEPFYGQYPIVSKEYAKLRKQVQEPSTTENYANIPFYVMGEPQQATTKMHRSPASFGTTRHFTGIISGHSSTVKPFYYKSQNHENNKVPLRNKLTGGTIYYPTTSYQFEIGTIKKSALLPTMATTTTIPKIEIPKDQKNNPNLRSSNDYFDIQDDTLLSIVDSLLDSKLNSLIEPKNDTYEDLEETTSSATTTELTTEAPATTLLDETLSTTTESEESNATTDSTYITTILLNSSQPVTVKSILNSTDCIDGVSSSNLLVNSTESLNKLEERTDPAVQVTTILPVDANEINRLEETNDDIFDDLNLSTTNSEELSTEETTPLDRLEEVTEIDLESRVKVDGNGAVTATATLRSIPKVPIEIEAILNITTKNKEVDYEYDYNEPTLPPSLPNLRIIPFVAADALDSKKEKHRNNLYVAQERVTGTSFGYTNLFSPPIETEGGFVPKEPPILDNFYENAVTVPPITNVPQIHEGGCISEGNQVPHGEPIPSDSPCITCSCFYGNIVCQKLPCPNPRPGCRKSPTQELGLCCPHYICGEDEAPTVVLDRPDGPLKDGPSEVVTVADGINTPDPFRDVIRTEPAPDLQSLIGDMMPFLARQSTTLTSTISTTPPQPTTTTTIKVKQEEKLKQQQTNNNNNDNNDNDEFSLSKVFQLLFSSENDEKPAFPKSTPTTTMVAPSSSELPKVTNRIKTTTEENGLTSIERRDNLNNINSVMDSSPAGVGLLKLAGCNIYGRMYRVGRIISELSNPCLECKCTEIGVQCRALKC